jgi:pyridoxine 4-dehydrogenase
MLEGVQQNASEWRLPMIANPRAGTVRLADDLVLTRMGFGAIQLAGPMAWGPPKDRDAAAGVLRAVVDLGITHIDTSDYYGPGTVNELIRETLHPYPAGLHVVTKVGARRGPDKSWPAALSRDELVQAVHDNLEHLGVESLDLVNLRMTDSREAAAIAGPFSEAESEVGTVRNIPRKQEAEKRLNDKVNELIVGNSQSWATRQRRLASQRNNG